MRAFKIVPNYLKKEKTSTRNFAVVKLKVELENAKEI